MAKLGCSARLPMVGALGGLLFALMPVVAYGDPGQDGYGDLNETFRARSIQWARDQLASGDSLTRVRALRHLALEGVEVDQALDLACELAVDREPLVRKFALWILGEMRGLSPEETARRWGVFEAAIFEDADEGVRSQACHTAVETGVDGPPDVLVGLLDAEILDPGALVAVASALGRAGRADRAVEEILPGVGSPHERAARRAVAALRGLGADARAAVPALVERLRATRDGSLRDEIVAALAEIGDESGKAAEALAWVVDTQLDLDWSSTGAAAAAALASVGDPRGAVERLAARLRSSAEPTRWAAGYALGALPEAVAAYPEPVVALLGDPSAEVRSHALSALDAAGVGDLVKTELLAMAAHEPDPDVRLGAITLLAAVGTGQEALALLAEQRERAPDPEQVEMIIVQVAGMREDWRPEGLRALLTELLESDSALVRVCALEVLHAREPADREALVGIAKEFAASDDVVLSGGAVQFLARLGLVDPVFTEEVAAATLEARQTSTLSNIRQLLTATLSFAEDYEGLLPGAEWPYAIQPYCKNCQILRSEGCGEQYLGFALSESRLGISLSSIHRPSETVLLFEALGADESPVGGKGRLADWWGDGTVIIGFADGHAKRCTREEAQRYLW